MTIEREEPALTGLDERTSLRRWLDYHRATLLWKCEGLTAEQLAERSVPPSTMSLLVTGPSMWCAPWDLNPEPAD